MSELTSGTGTTASDWGWMLYHGPTRVLVIVDMNRGRRSVTNDIEAVISACHDKVGVHDTLVVYRDSDGVYDEVIVEGGEFKAFHALGEPTVLDAVTKVCRRHNKECPL